MGGNILFRMRCVDVGNSCWKLGEIIEVDENNEAISIESNGKESGICTKIFSLKEWTNRTSPNGSKWELIEEEGENKMEDLRELIKPCYLLVLENDVKVKTVETQKGIVGQYQYGGWDELNTMINEVEKIYGFSTHGANIGEFSEECRPLIYERISPTQLKLEELEKKQREIADEMEKLRKEL